jgi:periplasmic divalent cation tolerance protein
VEWFSAIIAAHGRDSGLYWMTKIRAAAIETTLPGSWNEMEIGHFAAEIVESGVAGCVQFHNIRSVYRWKGETLNESEWHLSIKTSVEASSRLLTKLEQLHPYDVPQILIKYIDSTEAYSNWLITETESRSNIQNE